jgi:hypothetical protein
LGWPRSCSRRAQAGGAQLGLAVGSNDAVLSVLQLTDLLDQFRWAPTASEPASDHGRGRGGGRGLAIIRRARDDVRVEPSPDWTIVRLRHCIAVSGAAA